MSLLRRLCCTNSTHILQLKGVSTSVRAQKKIKNILTPYVVDNHMISSYCKNLIDFFLKTFGG